MLIIDYERAHLTQLVSLYSRIMIEKGYQPPGYMLRESLAEAKLSRSKVNVAIDNSSLIGFGELAIERHFGFLEGLFVEESHRNRGIGSILIQDLEARAKNMNLVSVETDSATDAVEFYRKLGFEKQFEVKMGIRDDISAVRMIKYL